jgi:hypothetical protein
VLGTDHAASLELRSRIRLQADPRVAVTIDVIGPPPRVLLAIGTAELTTVDGVPDGYLQASHRTTPRPAWDDRKWLPLCSIRSGDPSSVRRAGVAFVLAAAGM